MAGLAYDTLRVVIPTQIYSRNRLALLRHLLRHDHSLEYYATSMSAGRYRHVRGPARAGRPRLHWADSTMTEALNRYDHIQSDIAPLHSDIHNSYFQLYEDGNVQIALQCVRGQTARDGGREDALPRLYVGEARELAENFGTVPQVGPSVAGDRGRNIILRNQGATYPLTHGVLGVVQKESGREGGRRGVTRRKLSEKHIPGPAQTEGKSHGSGTTNK